MCFWYWWGEQESDMGKGLGWIPEDFCLADFMGWSHDYSQALG